MCKTQNNIIIKLQNIKSFEHSTYIEYVIQDNFIFEKHLV